MVSTYMVPTVKHGGGVMCGAALLVTLLGIYSKLKDNEPGAAAGRTKPLNMGRPLYQLS